MKKTKRILSLLIAIVIMVSSLAIASNAEFGGYKRYKGFVYSDDYGYIIIFNYKRNKTKLTIPEKIKGKTVKSVVSLKGAKKLKTLHVPATVNNLVLDAPVLEKVTIDEDNKYYKIYKNFLVDKSGKILNDTFATKKNVKIPDSITTIGVDAFSCTDITKVTLGKNVTKIDTWAFTGCENLKEIKFNKKLKTIKKEAFGSCSSLKVLKFPKSVKKLSPLIVNGCDNLEKVYIYNKDCKIPYSKWYYFKRALPEDLTIYGYKGSTAEEYATKNGNRFAEIKK